MIFHFTQIEGCEAGRTIFRGFEMDKTIPTGAIPFLNPEPSTLNPQPSTLNPHPSTLTPQPSTLNPQPSTLKPQPSTEQVVPAGSENW